MKLTKEEAISYHRQMWSDMQKELGDNPKERIHFKRDWVNRHFPDEQIFNNCFLCEYTNLKGLGCDSCPIKWHNDYCGAYYYYLHAPISEILALPERDEVD